LSLLAASVPFLSLFLSSYGVHRQAGKRLELLPDNAARPWQMRFGSACGQRAAAEVIAGDNNSHIRQLSEKFALWRYCSLIQKIK